MLHFFLHFKLFFNKYKEYFVNHKPNRAEIQEKNRNASFFFKTLKSDLDNAYK